MKIEADNYFAIIPEWILDADISPRAKNLYCILWTYADRKDGSCYPSVTTLSKRVGVSRANTHKLINELLDLGAITKQNRVKDNVKQTNLYFLITSKPSVADDSTTSSSIVDDTRGSIADDTRVVSETIHRTITNELKPIEQEYVEKPQVKKIEEDVLKQRKALYRVFVDELGYEPRSQMEKSGWFKVCKELTDVGVTTDMLKGSILAYKKHWNNIDITPYAINKWFGKFEALGKDEARKKQMQENPTLICEEKGHHFIDHNYFLYCIVCKLEQKK
jgi:hypothetical protein